MKNRCGCSIFEFRAVLHCYSSQLKNNHFTEMCSGFEAGSHVRLIDSCTTQLKAQGPSRTCNEIKKEDEELAEKDREVQRLRAVDHDAMRVWVGHRPGRARLWMGVGAIVAFAPISGSDSSDEYRDRFASWRPIQRRRCLSCLSPPPACEDTRLSRGGSCDTCTP